MKLGFSSSLPPPPLSWEPFITHYLKPVYSETEYLVFIYYEENFVLLFILFMFQLLVYLYITRLRICLEFCFKIQALTIGRSGTFFKYEIVKKRILMLRKAKGGGGTIYSQFSSCLPGCYTNTLFNTKSILIYVFSRSMYIFWSKACQVDSERNIIQSTRVIQHKCAIHKSDPIQYKCYTRIIHSARAIQYKSLHDSCNKSSPIQSKLLAFFLKASCKKVPVEVKSNLNI